ncbi:MAG: SPOR domain-containing protein [Rubricoccaceae bacterium]
MRRSLLASAALGLALTVAACAPSAPRVVVEEQAPPPPAFPAYESFDPSAYNARPPLRAEVVHDVPARQMQGRVDLPGSTPAAPREREARQVEGLRVQIFASPDRAAAERVRAEALAWWQTARREPRAPALEMEAIIAYMQPTYRVRLGAFASQAEADAALAFVRRRYADAFLVPDLITVYE